MLARLRGGVGTETNQDELSTGRVWVAGFQDFTARSRLERVLKLTNPLLFPNFFFGPRKTADN